MTQSELLIHRWCQLRFSAPNKRGRNRKGVRATRKRKWQQIKHQAKKLGIKFN